MDDSPSGGVELPPMEDPDAEQRWVAGVLRLYLDDEWTPLECHAIIGERIADIYMERRRAGAPLQE